MFSEKLATDNWHLKLVLSTAIRGWCIGTVHTQNLALWEEPHSQLLPATLFSYEQNQSNAKRAHVGPEVQENKINNLRPSISGDKVMPAKIMYHA